MLKEPKFIAIAIAIALTCNHANAQEDLKSHVDRMYDSAWTLDLKNQESVKVIATNLFKLSTENEYELGKVKAEILAAYYLLNKFKLDTAQRLLQECESFLKADARMEHSLERGHVNLYAGEIAFRKMELDAAEKYAKQAITIFEHLGNVLLTGSAFAQLGTIETLRLNDFKALGYYLRGFQLKMASGAELKRARAEIENIAIIYRKMGQFDKALEFFRKVEIIGKTTGIYNVLVNTNIEIGKIKFELGEYDSALHYFQRSRQIAEVNNNPTLTSVADYSIAELYSTQKRYTESNTLVLALLKRNFSPHSSMAESVRILTSTNYLNLKQYDSAMLLAKDGMNIAVRHARTERISSFAKILSEIFEARDKPDSALFYFKMHYALNDSLYSQENQRKLSTLYAEVENLAKQQEIDSLEKQSAVEKAQNKALIIAIVLGATTCGFVLISLVLQYRNRQKKQLLENITLQQELELKKKDLHEQALRMIYVNNELKEIEESLKKIKSNSNGNTREVQELLSTIHVNKSLEKEWDNFTAYFGSVHVGFYEKFNGHFPNVTLAEKRLAGLIRMNMTNSEIAGILNIESASVKTAKYRLKKKVGLSDEQDINSFLQTF